MSDANTEITHEQDIKVAECEYAEAILSHFDAPTVGTEIILKEKMQKYALVAKIEPIKVKEFFDALGQNDIVSWKNFSAGARQHLFAWKSPGLVELFARVVKKRGMENL